jgi:hypothetical protein
VIAAPVRSGLLRAGLIAGAFTLGALAVGRAPLSRSVQAAGMLALPCALFAVLKREHRRLARAAEGARTRSAKPPAPEAPAPPRR